MSERINTPYTSEHFVAFCLSMLGQPYWYGTVVYKCSESLRSRKAKQYPSHYKDSRTARYKQDIANKKVCADCVGLIKGYNWTSGGVGVKEAILSKVSSDKFKSWKEVNVSPALRENDFVDSFTEFDTLSGCFHLNLDYCLDRTAFESCLADYLRQFPQLINDCLKNAGMTGNDVDLVIVTGGHSQWYFVRDMLEGKMPQLGNVDLPKIRENPGRIIPISRPQETVALGLAYNRIHDTGEDEPTPSPVGGISEPTFTMEITQKFSTPGGACVGGVISLGEVSVGDVLLMWDADNMWVADGVSVHDARDESAERHFRNLRSVKVKKIELKKNGSTEQKPLAVEDESVVLLLEGIKEAELYEGLILFKDTNDACDHAPLSWVQQSVERWKARQPIVPGPDNGESDGGKTIDNGGTTVNGNILGMGSVVYTIPKGKSVSGAVQTVSKFLVSKKMEVQELKTEEGYVVQARKKGLFNKNAKGNASTLEIRLMPIGDDQVSTKVGGGTWASIAAKSGGAIISTLLLGPLAPVGAIGFASSAISDAKMLEETKKIIKDYFNC